MEYKVPRDRILLCKIMIFDSYDPHTCGLTMRRLTAEEELRPAIFMDGDVIDFATGEVIKQLERDEEGYITGQVDADTMYYDNLFKADIKVVNEEGKESLNDDDENKELYEAADALYDYYLERKQLIQDGNVVEFKKKRLY